MSYRAYQLKQAQERQSQLPQPKQNLWGKSLSALGWIGDKFSRANYAMANADKTAYEKYKDKPAIERLKAYLDPDVLKAAYRGATGKDKTTYSDVLDQRGVKNKYVKGIGGFALDVALDPTTYMTLGTGTGAKIATKAGAKTLTKTGSKQLARMSTTLGREGAEKVIEKAANKSPALAQKLIDKGGLKFAGITLPGTEKVVNPVSKYVRGLTGKVGREAGVVDNLGYVRTQQGARDLTEAGIRRYEEGYRKAFSGLKKADKENIYKAIYNGTEDALPSTLRGSTKFAKRELDDILKKETGFGFDIAKRENYVPQVYKDPNKAKVVFGDKVSSDIRFGQARKIEAKTAEEFAEKAKAAGLKPEMDIEKVLATRRAGSVKGIEQSKFLTNVAKTEGAKRIAPKAERLAYEASQHKSVLSFLVDRTKKHGGELTEKQRKFYMDLYNASKGEFAEQAQKKGKNVIKTNIPEFGRSELAVRELKGVTIPNNIKEHIQTMGQTAIKDADVHKVIKLYDNALKKIKSSLTTYFPSFHTRNAASNIFQNYLDVGAVQALNPKFHKNAVKIMSGKYLDDIVEIGGSSYTVREMRRMMQDNGVLQGMGQMDVGGAAGKWQLGKRAATGIENEARGVNFLANFERSGDALTAAERTKKFLFDYDNLTSIEKEGMRRIFPFWTWTAKNTALQAEQMLKQPGKYASMFKAKNSLESNITDDERKLMPDYMQNKLNIKIGDGKYLSGFGSPMEEFSETLANPLNKAVGMMSPFIKMPVEAGKGIDLFYGKPIEEITNAENLKLLMKIAPKGVKDAIGYDEREKTINEKVINKATANPWVLWVSRQAPLSRFGSTSAQLTNETSSLPGRIGRTLTGVAERNIDPESQAYFKGEDYKKQLAQQYVQRGILKESDYGGYYVPKNVAMTDAEREEANYMKNILDQDGSAMFSGAAGLEKTFSDVTSTGKKLSKREQKIAMLLSSISGLPAEDQKVAMEAIKYLAMGYNKVPSYAKSKSGGKTTKAYYKAVPTVNKRNTSKTVKSAPKVKMAKKWRS